MDRAGATAVAGVPAAAAFVALADPQVRGAQVTAHVACEVGQGSRSSGDRGSRCDAAVWAVPADESEPVGV
ncbi:hypothetical protein GCM10010129_73790 [Streptomyces fumigatiscleroticus]|nr:hypothetical protein GCM10010129_73790 [Streptomyces fumigatiscleroticus]